MLVFEEFLKTVKFETRAVENIPATELKAYLNEFVLSVRKKQNKDEYEPCTLKSFISSFELYFKCKDYGWSILNDAEFENIPQRRKTIMMQALTNNNIPPTDIIQLSGHKNVRM